MHGVLVLLAIRGIVKAKARLVQDASCQLKDENILWVPVQQSLYVEMPALHDRKVIL